MIPVLPVVEAEPADRPQRSKGRTLVAVAGVVALVAAGAFAVVSIGGNDAAGGASSPTEVGVALTDALSNEDVLGVVDLLLPGERNTFREPMIEGFDNLRRLGIVADDASLGGIAGFDVEFNDVAVTEESTGAADIVNIVLSGSATASVDGASLPLGDLIITDMLGGVRPDMDIAPQTGEFDDVRLTVVERDGRWYLSMFYSIAESLRDGGEPVPAAGIPTPGADSPEAAMTSLLQAVSDQDLGAALGMLDPEEFEALQRYAPLFLDEAQQEIDAVGLQWSISDVSVIATGSGDRRSVEVPALTFRAEVDGSSAEVRFADGCYTAIVDGETMDGCSGDASGAGSALDSLGGDGLDPSVATFANEVDAAFGDLVASGIAVHEVGGRWYVSPMRTGFDGMNSVLAALDRGEISSIASSFGDVMSWLVGGLDDGLGLGAFGDVAGLDPFGIDEQIDFGDMTGDMTGDTGMAEGGLDALNACYGLGASDGPQCIVDGIAAGTIDPTFAPVTAAHPECGVAAVYWSDMYSLSDADFTAMITAASPCFLDLVARGEVDAFVVPSELLAPQCAQGLNIYTATSDQANSFYECAAAAMATP